VSDRLGRPAVSSTGGVPWAACRTRGAESPRHRALGKARWTSVMDQPFAGTGVGMDGPTVEASRGGRLVRLEQRDLGGDQRSGQSLADA